MAPARKADLEKAGTRILEIQLKNRRIDLAALMQQLGAMEISSLLVEGGSAVLASAFQSGIVDKVQFFYAPKVLGGDDGVPICSGPGPELMRQSVPIKDIAVSRVDDDILIEGYVEKG